MHRKLLILLAIFCVGPTVGCGDNDLPLSTIGDYVRAEARFSSLEAALRDTDLLATLDGPGPYTLFAFTNSEFDPADLPADRLERLVAYHIHEGALSSEQLRSITAATTLEGTEIHLRYGLDGMKLNDGVLITGDPIETDNGTIYVLDRALSRTLVTTTATVESQPNIPIEGFAADTLSLDAPGYIHDLRVSLAIEQADIANLYVFLQHVDSGTFIRLVRGPSSHLGGIATTFADSADHDVVNDVIRDGNPGESAFPQSTYRPVEPLEYLVGEALAGDWRLTIYNFGEEAGPSQLISWGMTATVGADLPAPAIVFNPRVHHLQTAARGFNEVASADFRRVGGLAGEVEVAGTLGDLQATATTVAATDNDSPLFFTVPESADLGPRDVVISARSGETSRVISYDASVVQPKSEGMELLAHVPLPQLGAFGGAGNDIWGWTDPQTGSEIALVGTTTNTAFVDISQPTSPVVLGTLPTATETSIWRDIKVFENHAFIVSEATDHGLQVFDLTELRNAPAGKTFAATAHIDDFGSAHNIAIDEGTATAYVVGSDYEGCHGGLLTYDISTPTAPIAIGCFSGGVTNSQPGGPAYPTDVYTHDVQCVTYQGPDLDYQGREICFTSDEQSIGIADFDDTANPVQIVRLSYENVGYTHQGWLTEDHQFFIVNDEFDEVDQSINTRSYVWDVRDLDNPVLQGFIDNPSQAIGHNAYIAGGVAYQANYSSGLRLVDVSDIASGGSSEVAYYDTDPDDDATCSSPTSCGIASYDGAWSNYPFFDSGVIVVSDTLRGLFVLRRTN